MVSINRPSRVIILVANPGQTSKLEPSGKPGKKEERRSQEQYTKLVQKLIQKIRFVNDKVLATRFVDDFYGTCEPYSILLHCLLVPVHPATLSFSKRIGSSCNKTFFNQITKTIIRSSSSSDFTKSIQPYLRLMRVDKPTGFWLLYWPCTWSIALAAPPGSLPDLKMLALFATGSILMRSAGCIVNDIFDKDYDKMVERTQSRPLARGEITNGQAVALLAVLLSGSLSILLQFSWFSVAVGASSLFLVIVYPLAKRYTYWPQLVLVEQLCKLTPFSQFAALSLENWKILILCSEISGLTSNWGVFIAWCHLCPNTLLTIVPLYIATVFYTVTYDTIYSQQGLDRQKSKNIVPHESRDLKLETSLLFSGITFRLVFNWGALLGWVVIRDELCTSVVLLLYMASVNWTLIYDTIYAHQDKTDDLIAGIKSTALLFGDKTKYWLSGFAAFTLLGLGTTGIMTQQTWPFTVH
ncbi:4-hydroxybenzoate polyprenyltransferase, mitochondrial [Dirofilaria immitis]|nr:4-hydroxybenzoate polyprenyltransferase, mitochondrial [Dirofilaria immitis]